MTVLLVIAVCAYLLGALTVVIVTDWEKRARRRG
jgi:hypothetical protein